MITIEENGVKRQMTKDDLPNLMAALGCRADESSGVWGRVWRFARWLFDNAQALACLPFVIIGYLCHKVVRTVTLGVMLGWTASRDFDEDNGNG